MLKQHEDLEINKIANELRELGIVTDRDVFNILNISETEKLILIKWINYQNKIAEQRGFYDGFYDGQKHIRNQFKQLLEI